MRVAAIYDIHGNLPALRAVLAEIEGEAVDVIVVGGDILPGPFARQVLKALRELDTPCLFIKGNGEADVLTTQRGEVPSRVPPAFRESLQWVAATLSAADMAAIATWPIVRTVDLPDVGRVCFCHATPRDDNEIFTEITPEDRLLDILDTGEHDVVVCGHTHMPFQREIGSVRVVNAGSVGMPFGKPGAYWLLITDDIEIRRTLYDFEAADKELRAVGYPDPSEYRVSAPPSRDAMVALFEAAAMK